MALSATQQRAPDYPDSYTVPPRSGQHRHSFIVLHGRGDEGQNFGTGFLMTGIPGFKTLQEAFPDGKWIFPTASKRRALALNRTPVHQWFDLWSIKEQTKKEGLQFDGLRESYRHVRGLLEAEIADVGAENVVLWGLSQGMAMSMVTLLLWPGPRIAAVVGMCGWVPLKAHMEREVWEEEVEGEENPFEESENKKAVEAEPSKFQKVVRYLHEELQLSAEEQQSATPLEIPVFLGHGTEDEKVPTMLGEQAGEFLQLLKFDVELQLYEGLHHWYSPHMLRDIVNFLQRKTGVKPVGGSTEEGGAS